MSLVDDYTIEERPGTEERHGFCRGAPNIWGVWGAISGPPISLVSAPPQKRRNVVIVLAVQRAVALGACLAEASPPCGHPHTTKPKPTTQPQTHPPTNPTPP